MLVRQIHTRREEKKTVLPPRYDGREGSVPVFEEGITDHGVEGGQEREKKEEAPPAYVDSV